MLLASKFPSIDTSDELIFKADIVPSPSEILRNVLSTPILLLDIL